MTRRRDNGHVLESTIDPTPQSFSDPDKALQRIIDLYESATRYLRERLAQYEADGKLSGPVRACYPYAKISNATHSRADTRLSFGFVADPGTYATTLTRPELFGNYLREQLTQLLRNHDVVLEVGVSDEPIPIHFASADSLHLERGHDPGQLERMRDLFDTPDLAAVDDSIVNGTNIVEPGAALPLALFNAPRIDFSLHRLRHYTATSPVHFQNSVIFTNYQFYIDEFVKFAHEQMTAGNEVYNCFVEPGDTLTWNARHGGRVEGEAAQRLPQMPAYHLKRGAHAGITMVNIGVGPSNAKTITDHLAVLRPHVWLMLGHCAGLRNSQKQGDYVLAHGYVREDHVLDEELPTWVPVPPLAEVQVAIEQSVSEVTGLTGWALKSVMRTGTVATIGNRNWELRQHSEPLRRFSQSRAIALDMESATIAANGFRFRVPYGTLLCVSDKPLHGEIKLPAMANEFYRTQVGQHLQIGILAMEKLRGLPLEQLHSRKLRSFDEPAFQ